MRTVLQLSWQSLSVKVYLLPVIFRHSLQLVGRYQLPQHLGNHYKLVLVIVDFYPEEQSCDADHFLFGTNMIASQVLG